ncbi:MAG TPA: thioredoxin TrxC [Longimicrobiales bacterium]|nr:thioredoxin TrxC [Longimicrobiales bacterium]
METKAKGPQALVRCALCSALNRVDMSRAQDRPKCGECGRPMLLDRPLQVTDADLERTVRETAVPVLVDFYADWCGPCKVMAPVLDDVASARAGRVLVLKLDTDRNPTMAVRYAIRGIPTLIMFVAGREYAREVGAVPRVRLDALIDRALSGAAPERAG